MYPVEPATVGGGTGTVTGCGGSASSSPSCTSSGAPCTTFYSVHHDGSNPLDPRNNKLTGVRDGRSASATDNTYLTSYAQDGGGAHLADHARDQRLPQRAQHQLHLLGRH